MIGAKRGTEDADLRISLRRKEVITMDSFWIAVLVAFALWFCASAMDDYHK